LPFSEAFTTGSWACHFGGPEEVRDIARACGAAAQLLGSGKLPPETPVLCTKCYTEPWQLGEVGGSWKMFYHVF